MRRRRLLTLASAGLLAGCVDSGGGGSRTGTEEQPTDSATTAPTETTTTREDRVLTSIPPTETRSLSEDPEVESLLQPAGDGWELIETGYFGYSYLGGEDAVEGLYEADDGVVHHVVVFEAVEGDIQITASQFECAGWPIVVVRDQYVIAAGTGTTSVTLTPRHPETLSETPIPEKVDHTRELLLRSAYLDSSHLETTAIECNRVTSSRTE